MIIFVSEATRRYANNLNDLRERHEIRIEKPSKVEWILTTDFTQDIKKLDGSGLSMLKAGLGSIRDEIKEDISIRKRNAAKYREYSDPVDMKEITLAYKSLVKHIHLIDAEFTLRRETRRKYEEGKISYPEDGLTSKERRRRKNAGLETYILDVVRENIDPDKFRSFVEIAKERKQMDEA